MENAALRSVPWDDLRRAVEASLDATPPLTPEMRRLRVGFLSECLAEMRRRCRSAAEGGGGEWGAWSSDSDDPTVVHERPGPVADDLARRTSVAAGAWEDPPNPGETFAQYWDRTRGAECGTWAEVHAGAGLPPAQAPEIFRRLHEPESVPPFTIERDLAPLGERVGREVDSRGRVWDLYAAHTPDAPARGAVTYALTRGAVADAIASGSTIDEAVDIGARAFAAASAAEADELPAGARALAADLEAVERAEAKAAEPCVTGDAAFVADLTPDELRARARRMPPEWLKPIRLDAAIAAIAADLLAIAHDQSPWPLPACSTCKQPAGAGPRNRLVVPKLGFRFPIFLVPCPACIPGAADDWRRRALAVACAQEVRRLKLSASNES